MNFVRRHWYDLGMVVAVGAAIVLIVLWQNISILQRLLLLNFIVILVHQYEEYGWPGGEPVIMNMVLQPSPTPDRFPLNQHSAMVINVLASYVFYLVPAFFPRVIWLGLAPTLFGMLQFIVHGIVTNKKLRTLYNPGLGAVLFGHIPIAICYIYYIQMQGLAGIWDWLGAVTYMLAFMYIAFVKMTYSWLADRDSPYRFSEEEMNRFSVRQKIDQRRVGNSN
jgi:Protein of unknown function with HXXEE motif